jgi:hypothetical protein
MIVLGGVVLLLVIVFLVYMLTGFADHVRRKFGYDYVKLWKFLLSFVAVVAIVVPIFLLADNQSSAISEQDVTAFYASMVIGAIILFLQLCTNIAHTNFVYGVIILIVQIIVSVIVVMIIFAIFGGKEDKKKKPKELR